MNSMKISPSSAMVLIDCSDWTHLNPDGPSTKPATR